MDNPDDLFSALYKALDRLEELDPNAPNEEWFQLLEDTASKILAPHFEKVLTTKH
jgi:hypothetical protein